MLKFLILLQCEYRYIHINQQIDRWFLQSSLLFFYITSIFRWFESHQVILWFHLLSSWSHSLINFAFIDRFSQLLWKSRYSRNLRISYSRIVNDSLNLIRRTRQVALWHRRLFFFWDLRFFEFVENCVNLEIFLQIKTICSDVFYFIAFMTNEMRII
jgi:hypothetical protein